MSIVNCDYVTNRLYLDGICIKTSNLANNSVTELNLSSSGQVGRYLMSNGEWGDYNDVSLERITAQTNTLKLVTIPKEMVTYVTCLVEIDNSITILYINSYGRLNLIRKNVEYLIAENSSTTHATIMLSSAGNILIGNVTDRNLYHHYYNKGTFETIPIDITHKDEKFASHIAPNGCPCYIYTRYNTFDEIMISYSNTIQGDDEWNITMIISRPPSSSEYFRSFALCNHSNGIMYLAESCKNHYFAISECSSIPEQNWKIDVVKETGYEQHIIYRIQNEFIVDSTVYYYLNDVWKTRPTEIPLNTISVLDYDLILTSNGLSGVLSLDYILTGSIIKLPDGSLLIVVVNATDSILIYKYGHL